MVRLYRKGPQYRAPSKDRLPYRAHSVRSGGRPSLGRFVTERKARIQLPAADLDTYGRARLSYQQAAARSFSFCRAFHAARMRWLRTASSVTVDSISGVRPMRRHQPRQCPRRADCESTTGFCSWGL